MYQAEIYDIGFPQIGWIQTGIVSKGYGCGSKDYSGLYTPINNPKYLSWIRKHAF